jgi:hypothetical protein
LWRNIVSIKMQLAWNPQYLSINNSIINEL